MHRVIAAIALISVVGCTTRTIKYAGTAMDDTRPDSANTLSLTLWTSGDTAFRGIVRLAPSIGGDQSAFLWHEDGETRMVTVSDAGDTVYWQSRSGDSALGGRFSFTGGARKGSGGTWRARLSSGPPATAATARAAGPSLGNLEPVVVAIAWVALLFGVGRWIAHSPRTKPAEQPVWSKSVTGIGGWLAFFVFTQSVSALISIATLPNTIRLISDAWALGSIIGGYRALLSMEAVAHVGQIVFAIGAVVLILRRHRVAPRFCFAYLAIMAGYAVTEIIGGTMLRSALADVASDESPSALGSARTTSLRLLLLTLLWATYWAKSVRVRATFGHGALDRSASDVPVTVPAYSPIADSPNAEPSSPERTVTR